MPAPARLLAGVLVALLGSCADIDGGHRAAALEACRARCETQSLAAGCAAPLGPCHQGCEDDANGLSERCVVVARSYHECSIEVAWSCPVAPDRPETDDTRCEEDRRAYLRCRVMGAP